MRWLHGSAWLIAFMFACVLVLTGCAAGPDEGAEPGEEPAPEDIPAEDISPEEEAPAEDPQPEEPMPDEPVPEPLPGEQPDEPMPEEPQPEEVPPPIEPGQPDKTTEQEKFDEILQSYLERMSVNDQQQELESRKWYDIAVHYKSTGQLESAKTAVEHALRVWPGNRQARLLKDELDRILRHPDTIPPEKVRETIEAQWKGQIIESLNKIRAGERYLASREYEKAQHEFEEAEVQILAMPDQLPEKGSFLPVVRDYLRKIRDAIEAQVKAKIELDKRAAEHVQQVIAEAEKKEVVRRIAQLLEMAYMAFDQRRYEHCQHLCDKIMWIDPNYTVARDLKEDARKAYIHRDYRDRIIGKIRGWKAMTQSDKEAEIPYVDAITYPSHQKWMEIEKRAQESVLKTLDEFEEPEPIVAVRNKLRSMKVDLNWESETVGNVLAFLREYTNLNIIVDPEVEGDVDPDAEVSFKARGITVATALKYILAQISEDLAYTITEEKLVMITSLENSMGKPIFELYDIRDLTMRLSNFPGPRLELLPGRDAGGGPGVSFTLEEPEEPKVSSDDIVTLIQENIHVAVWENSDLYMINMTPNNQLLVSAPAETHKEIRRFLEKLRSYSGVMVSVICRFLAAYDDFLQDVGWNLPAPVGEFDPVLPDDFSDPTGVTGATPYAPWPWIPGLLEGAGTDMQGQVFHSLLNGDPGFAAAGIAMTFDPTSGRLRNTGGLGLGYTWIGEDGTAINAMLRMLDKHHKATIVQAPRIMAFNGQRAHFLSVNRLAYVRDIDIGAAGFTAIVDLVIGYLNHGLVLDVRPIVSHDRKYVTMEVRADFADLVLMRPMNGETGEFEEIQGQPQQPPQPGTPPPTTPSDVARYWIQLPYIVYQRVNTTALVPDRGTMVIGGFRDLQMQDAYSGLPFLENIPVIDFFFSRKGKRDEKRRLFVLLTPEIVDVAEREKKNFD